MLQKIKAKIVSILTGDPQLVKVTDTQTNVRVLCPKGYIAYFFKNVVVVSTNERQARRQYENLLRKEIKLEAGKNNSK